MKKRLVSSLTIKRIAQGGDGVAHLPDGRVLFVEDGLPGDVVDVELSKDNKTWARGKVVRVNTPSPARTVPECAAFRDGCGGCQFWGVKRNDELSWKKEAAFEAMKRISGIDDLIEPEVIIGSDRNYRSKVTFHQVDTDEGEVLLGFYKTGSKTLVPVDRCLIARPEINNALEEFGSVLSYLGAGDITFETAGENRVVISVVQGPKGRVMPGTLSELARWLEQGQVVSGIEIIDGLEKHYVVGDSTISASESFADQPVDSLRHQAGLFRQSNQAMNKRLVEAVVEALGNEEPVVLELFSGAGNFTFPMLEVAARVVAVEGSAKALEVAHQIKVLATEGDSLSLHQADLFDEKVVEEVLDLDFDVLVLDPPRDGAFAIAKQLAEDTSCRKIIYVSCDPACLARDLKVLVQGGWQLESLRFYDLFPRTTHLETLAILTRG